MTELHLLLISRDDILSITDETGSRKLFRILARMTRSGVHFLATAPQPDHWSVSKSGPDEALLGPDSIRGKLADEGGVIDGVYYVPRSLLTQKRNRHEALKDILSRYSTEPNRCYLYSSSKKFVDAAAEMGFNAIALGKEANLLEELEQLLERITPPSD